MQPYNSSFKLCKFFEKTAQGHNRTSQSVTVTLSMNHKQKNYLFPKIEDIYFAIKFCRKFLVNSDPVLHLLYPISWKLLEDCLSIKLGNRNASPGDI